MVVTLIFVAIGIYVSKYVKDPLSFYIMKRQAPSWLLVGTMTATILSGMTFFAITGLWYKLGFTITSYTWLGVWTGLPIGLLYCAFNT